LQIVIIIYYYNFNNALKKFLRYIFIFYKGRFEMKYLLILFGLSSILASDKSEDPVLKELMNHVNIGHTVASFTIKLKKYILNII
jgi:hypothetical protein